MDKLESALIKGRVCLRHAKQDNNLYSDEVAQEIEEISNEVITGTKISPERWEDAWDFIFQNASVGKKIEFLQVAEKVMDDEQKKSIDRQILEKGSFLDSIQFCSSMDWADVPLHQDKILKTTSAGICRDFYKKVPTASYYKTFKRIIELKDEAKKNVNAEDVNKQIQAKFSVALAKSALDEVSKIMENSKVRRVYARRELKKIFPITEKSKEFKL